MVIIYDSTTKDILQVENNTMLPVLPMTPNNTLEEKKEAYASEGKAFVSVFFEMGVEVFGYNLCFDTNGNFVGLQPKQ